MTFIAEVKVWQDLQPKIASPSLKAAIAQAELVLERSHNMRTEHDEMRGNGWNWRLSDSNVGDLRSVDTVD